MIVSPSQRFVALQLNDTTGKLQGEKARPLKIVPVALLLAKVVAVEEVPTSAMAIRRFGCDSLVVA